MQGKHLNLITISLAPYFSILTQIPLDAFNTQMLVILQMSKWVMFFFVFHCIGHSENTYNHMCVTT